MKINRHIFHMPPYLSTSWANIIALRVEAHLQPLLIVTLANGTNVEIPQLEAPLLQAIFTIHSQVLEQEHIDPPQKGAGAPEQTFLSSSEKENTLTLSLDIPAIAESLENMGIFMQHNPEEMGASHLAPEILEKITVMSKAMGIFANEELPKPHPDCNCHFCQIARAMQGEGSEFLSIETVEVAENGMEAPEEAVSDDDLKFRIWDIQQTGETLYLVSNPLDAKEHYSVFLGDPIGCTCGQKNCEHIHSVLRT